MKYYRYMSAKEFALLTAGITLRYNKGTHKAKTSSNGFCFLGEVTELTAQDGKITKATPEECLEFLSGIVSDDVLVEFEAVRELKSGYGIYADPNSSDWDALVSIVEYSTMEYSMETMVPTRYYIPEGNWYTCNY